MFTLKVNLNDFRIEVSNCEMTKFGPFTLLEIKPCGLVSRIRDVEAS